MSEEDLHKAGMIMHALDQAINDLRDAAQYPEFVDYFARNWEMMRDAEKRFMEARHQIVRRAIKARAA